MKNRINEIKKMAKGINIDELIKTGKNVFGQEYFSEFRDSNAPGYILDATYICYSNEDKLVLECSKKFCDTKDPGDFSITDSDFKNGRDMIYIKGKQATEMSTEEGIEDKLQEYEEALQVIKSVQRREKMQKQHIRNFFRRIFAGKNNNLLDGKATTLTAEEITSMLAQIQEKQENFMEKYSTEKTDIDEVVNTMEKANEKNEQEIENEREEK